MTLANKMQCFLDDVDVINTEMIMPDQPPENDDGNREYKWRITPETPEEYARRCMKLATQLNFRMCEGHGKALYMLGISDCGRAVGIDQMSLYRTISIITEAASEIKKTKIDRIRLYKGRDGEGHIATLRFSNPRLINVW